MLYKAQVEEEGVPRIAIEGTLSPPRCASTVAKLDTGLAIAPMEIGRIAAITAGKVVISPKTAHVAGVEDEVVVAAEVVVADVVTVVAAHAVAAIPAVVVAVHVAAAIAVLAAAAAAPAVTVVAEAQKRRLARIVNPQGLIRAKAGAPTLLLKLSQAIQFIKLVSFPQTQYGRGELWEECHVNKIHGNQCKENRNDGSGIL